MLMIKEYIDFKSAGIYSIAMYINEIFYTIMLIVTTGLYPSLINAKKSNNAFYKKILVFYNLVCVFSLPIYLFIYFLNFSYYIYLVTNMQTQLCFKILH